MKKTEPETAILIQTIGHSTRTLEEFINLLKAYAVTEIVDIRTIPRSRANPQFNREVLPVDLNNAGINYRHMAGLGGLRRPKADSPNTAWRNASFRGFADYMQTIDFEQNLKELIQTVQKENAALMCAEAVPWRCHRSLIADALIVRGIRVEHIISLTNRYAHKITPWAKTQGVTITYPLES